MSLFSLLLAIDFCVLLIAWILFVIFGQATVRKLRKNSEMKDSLGIEFVSGWDILNVAQALTLPKKYAQWLNKGFSGKGVLGMLHADAELLYKHTTRFDRILARVFYIPFISAAFFALALCLMEYFGFFKH
jgi:hypothetical protein